MRGPAGIDLAHAELIEAFALGFVPISFSQSGVGAVVLISP